MLSLKIILNKIKISIFLSLIFFCILNASDFASAEICEAPIQNNCYYISTSGSDSDDGSAENPWLTFENAVSNLIQPGDYIYVRGGVYSQRTSIYGTNAILPLTNYASFVGDENNPVIFKAYPGEEVIIDALNSTDSEADAIIIRGANKRGIIIEGFKIRNSFGRANIFIEDNAHHIKIINNDIYNADGGDNVGGIYLGASQNITIENNLIYDNYKRLAPTNINNAGIFVFSGTTNIIIRNNEIYNSSQGIFYKHSGYGSSLFENNFFHNLTGSAFIIASDNVTMQNNLIINSNNAFNIHEEAGCVNCTRNSLISHNTICNSNFFVLNRGVDRPGAIGTIVRDNIFYNNESQEIEIWRYGSDADYINNVADFSANNNNYFTPALSFNYFGGSGAWGDLGGVYTLGQFQSFGYEANSFDGDPLFINSSGNLNEINDFLLDNNSPAKNSASDETDIGADIFLVGVDYFSSDMTPPSSPMGLGVI